jgi:dihydrofolate reductase
MAKLIYSTITSLDGYVADEHGKFDWSMPDEEVHAYINDLHRPVGTYLYGRRLYDVMVAWETWDIEGEDDITADWARIWRAAEKVVYSTTLPAVSSERTRLERTFDAAAVRELKSAASRDLTVGGPDLAAQAFAAGLVDECHLFLSPVMVGGGTPAFPKGIRLGLELRAERRFGNGVVHLHYAVADTPR